MKPEAQKKSIREVIRERFTPSRVGIVAWALTALFMGTVGFASFQFNDLANEAYLAGVRLPPPGDIRTTASTRPLGPGETLEVLQIGKLSDASEATSLNKGQIEVLQREIVGLRRRLSALSEQNLAYSRRIAALEKQVAIAKLAGAASHRHSDNAKAEEPPAPAAGVVITSAVPRLDSPETMETNALPAPEEAKPTQTAEAPDLKDRQPPSSAPNRQISIYNLQKPWSAQVMNSVDVNAPVRLQEDPKPLTEPRQAAPDTTFDTVQLPEPEGEPTVTGSIPPAPSLAPSEPFDAAPTRTTAAPQIVSPSGPSGRLNGGSANQIKRSDFGAVIGFYGSSAAAAKAWADFKEQNEERMRDLRPLLLQRQDGDGIALLVGPFANAADASVACFRLLDMTELCRPALYAGDPLVTASEFRSDAF